MADRWHPDPSLGVFETLLVVEGEPVELDAHLSRLARTLQEVYTQTLPLHVDEELRQAAQRLSLGRVRFTVFPTNGVSLRSHPVPGGNGPHKWVDRRDMEHPDAGPGQLIRDGEELLEAGWANLFAVREETLWTPPADGRILPGTARAALLEIAADEGIPSQEQPLRAQDLYTAEETFLTNSIRGIEPATELDGADLPGSGPISNRLAAALQRRWHLEPQAAAAARTTDQLSH